jgi:cysteine synthase
MLSTLQSMLRTGELKQDSTLILTTSGSAGVSLAKIQQALKEDCDVHFRTLVVAPKAYEHKAALQSMVHEMGVMATYDQPCANATSQLLFLEGTFMEAWSQARELAASQGFVVVDQHHDERTMLAHETTANELMVQLPGVTDVVCATGTGATAAGLRAFLPAHIKVHSRGSESGKIDGLSDVSRYDNYCDQSTLEGYLNNSYFDAELAKEHQQFLRDQHGIVSGPSTGATLWLAREVKKNNPDAQVAFISACGKMA